MIHKIVLSNFMAHAKTELQLADGITVLVGPNNIGKSTVAEEALGVVIRQCDQTIFGNHDCENPHLDENEARRAKYQSDLQSIEAKLTEVDEKCQSLRDTGRESE